MSQRDLKDTVFFKYNKSCLFCLKTVLKRCKKISLSLIEMNQMRYAFVLNTPRFRFPILRFSPFLVLPRTPRNWLKVISFFVCFFINIQFMTYPIHSCIFLSILSSFHTKTSSIWIWQNKNMYKHVLWLVYLSMKYKHCVYQLYSFAQQLWCNYVNKFITLGYVTWF